MHRVLTNARLTDGRLVDVHIADGRIARVAPVEQRRAEPTVVVDDLRGALLLPAMAEPHAHLDKALVADSITNLTGDLDGAIDAMVAAAGSDLFSHGGLVARATVALDKLVANGVTAVRSHVNVGEGIDGRYVAAIDEVRAAFTGIVDVQIVALTHSPLTGPEGAGNRFALDAAMAAGADVVGGCPHLDPNPAGLIEHVIAVATAAGVGIDLHMDETLVAEMLTLPELARQVRDAGFTGSVAASHCVSLAMQPVATQVAVAEVLAAERIAVIPLPQTNLYLQGRSHPSAMPRALAPISVLHQAGVLVAAGGDNVQDPFNPVGRSDPLETAALLVMAGHQQPDVAYRMVSNDVREVMGLPRVSITVGDPADLVAIDARSERAAIADAPSERRVYRAGRLVAVTTSTRNVLR